MHGIYLGFQRIQGIAYFLRLLLILLGQCVGFGVPFLKALLLGSLHGGVKFIDLAGQFADSIGEGQASNTSDSLSLVVHHVYLISNDKN